MVKYIKAEDLIDHILNEGRRLGEDYDWLQMLVDIEDFPAAEASPIVHGKWVWTDNPNGRPYCSRCNNDAFWDDDHGFVTENFCPFCGADMRPEATRDD